MKLKLQKKLQNNSKFSGGHKAATFFVESIMEKFAFYESKFGFIKIGYDKDEIFYIKTTDSVDCENEPNYLTNDAFGQLEEYFRKERRTFCLPLKLKGTPFQIKVWQELVKIPYGETRTYKEIAMSIGNPKASRAVGMANHNNPLWIVVPCHRVIGSNGKLTGYAGGVDMKSRLLQLEKYHK